MGIGTLNRIVLVGPVGRDPDIRRSRQGKKIATLFVVTYGARARRRQWNRVVCYIEALTEFIERHVRKGSKVCVEATLEVRKWLTEDGTNTWTSEIVISNGGKLTLLDWDDDINWLTEPPGPGEEIPLPPQTAPLSLKRPSENYADGIDTDTAGLARFLQTPDDADRARRRAAGEEQRRV